jgi:predicted nucleic acid-binding protein
MAAYVLDTSAVVKRYIMETGTAWVRSIADPAASNLIYSLADRENPIIREGAWV